MSKKPIEMEAQIAIKPGNHGPTVGDLFAAKKNIDDGMAAQFPAYRFVSQRTYTSGKLFHIARTYEYSRLKEFKLWILEKMGRRKQAEPIRHFGN